MHLRSRQNCIQLRGGELCTAMQLQCILCCGSGRVQMLLGSGRAQMHFALAWAAGAPPPFSACPCLVSHCWRAQSARIAATDMDPIAHTNIQIYKYTHTNTHTNKKNPTGNENGLNVTSLVCSQSTALKAAVVVFHNISIDSIVEYSTILVVQYFITWV